MGSVAGKPRASQYNEVFVDSDDCYHTMPR